MAPPYTLPAIKKKLLLSASATALKLTQIKIQLKTFQLFVAILGRVEDQLFQLSRNFELLYKCQIESAKLAFLGSAKLH